jgi:hypothetical protein
VFHAFFAWHPGFFIFPPMPPKPLAKVQNFDPSQYLTCAEYERRRGEALARLVVLEPLLGRVATLEAGFAAMRVDFGVLRTQVGMYAAIGAVVGGGFVSLVVFLVESFLKKGP